ncbi:MAG: phosphoglycerate kinase [Puniceicoccales bacterium]|jgi:3-phosphoglycerate kinase|nr:phosphoglycerate kinase [Puniceicoccales bacterium]
MRRIKTLSDISCKGKKVFVRVDFNVPIDSRGNVLDDSRIVAALPTIRYLVQEGARVILASHLGRPNGEIVAKYSLRNVAVILARHIGQPVLFLSDCVGEEVLSGISRMIDGSVALLENLRFHVEETANDEKFSQQLASLADVYVNDAFGSAHRAHASTEGITRFVKQSAAGLLMEKELEFLGTKIAETRHPFVVILGGAKVSDKIKVIDNLLEKADSMLIGGAMAYTFLAANGNTTGNSMVEVDKIQVAKDAIRKAKEIGTKLLLPVDHIVTSSLNAETNTIDSTSCAELNIPDGTIGVDIGPRTIELFEKEINGASTILWNGPMGIFERQQSSTGTFAIAKLVAESNAMSIIGGGDSAKAIKESGYADKVSFVSTGGGASLEFLGGDILPGVVALMKK